MNHVLSFFFIVHCSSIETGPIAATLILDHFRPSRLPAGRQGCQTRYEGLLNPQWVKAVSPLSECGKALVIRTCMSFPTNTKSP
jgi:hypothetical protein